jgi:hypothetical protein
MFRSCTYTSYRSVWDKDYFQYKLVDSKFIAQIEVVDSTRVALIEAIIKEYDRRGFSAIEPIARFYVQLFPNINNLKIQNILETDITYLDRRLPLRYQKECISRHIKLYLWVKGRKN